MDKDHFLKLVNNPKGISKQDAAGLLKVLHQYPYFQSAHLLYAALLASQKSYQLEIRLQTSALYAADRSRLYDLTRYPKASVIIKPAFNEGKTEETPATIPNLPKEDQPEIKTEAPKENKPLSLAEQILNQRLAEISGKTNVSEPVDAPKEDQPIISEKENLKEEEVIVPIETSVYAPEKDIPAEPEKIEPSAEAPAESNLDKKEIHSFTEWLKGKKENSTKEILSGLETQKKEDDKQVNKLIENFIASEPRIKPAKAEFYSPVNMARKSLLENDEIISETLAKIYMKQGNYQRALLIYEKLTLKYPEKSSSFAAEIEKLKELLKSL